MRYHATVHKRGWDPQARPLGSMVAFGREELEGAKMVAGTVSRKRPSRIAWDKDQCASGQEEQMAKGVCGFVVV